MTGQKAVACIYIGLPTPEQMFYDIDPLGDLGYGWEIKSHLKRGSVRSFRNMGL